MFWGLDLATTSSHGKRQEKSHENLPTSFLLFKYCTRNYQSHMPFGKLSTLNKPKKIKKSSKISFKNMEQHTVFPECLNDSGRFHATEDDQTANFHAQESMTEACKNIREWQVHCNQSHYDAGELGVGDYGGGNLGQGHHPQRMHGGDRPGPSNGARMRLRGGQAARYRNDSDSDSDSDSASNSDSGSNSNSESDSINNINRSNNDGLHSQREPNRLEGREPGGRGLPEREGIYRRATTGVGSGVRRYRNESDSDSASYSDSGSDSNSESDSIINNNRSNNNGLHSRREPHRLEGRGPVRRGLPERGIFRSTTTERDRRVRGVHTINDAHGVPNVQRATRRAGRGVQGIDTIHDIRGVEEPRTTRGGSEGVHTNHDARSIPNVQGMRAFLGEGRRLGDLGEQIDRRREGRRNGGRMEGRPGGIEGWIQGIEDHELRANHGGHGHIGRTSSDSHSLGSRGGSIGGRREDNESHIRENQRTHGGLSRTMRGGPRIDSTGEGARVGRFPPRPEEENPPPYGEPQHPRRGDNPPSYEESQRQNHSWWARADSW